MLHIGNIKLPGRPVFLAPMENITDQSFRLICKDFGVDMVYSEFIASEGLIRNIMPILYKINISEKERPVGIQLYGHHVDALVESVRIAETKKPDVIDLNFGCPVKKIVNHGDGAALLKDIPLMTKITRAVVKSTHLPVTVKTRLGWDDNTKHIVEIAKILQDTGIAAITIHGRTRAQLYRGKADWTLIGEVKNDPAITIPVIGNGDINSPEKAKHAFEHYGVDAIMIGRGSIGRPWLFKQIRHYLTTGEHLPEPGVPEKATIAKQHLLNTIKEKGELRGILEMRKQMNSYFKGLPNFKKTRLELLTSTDVKQICDMLDAVAEQYKHY